MHSRATTAACALSLFLLASAANAFEKRHIFVTNRGGSNIIELDDSLAFVKTWFDSEGLSVPNGMAFTPTGRLYVADTGNHRVIGFDENGVKQVEWPMASYSATAVEALNFDKKGVLYASSNPGDGRVPRFDMAGAFVSYLVNDPSFFNLGNVNFTNQGTVILSDFSALGRGTREVDPANGNVIATFGQEVGLLQEDMFVDATDRIFISELSKNHVAVYAPDRTLERTFTEPGLLKPTGIVITHDCRVIVASFGSAELYVFHHDGTFVEKHSYAGMSLPESLAIAGQRLPGSFEDPTMEFVPKCDGTDPDGGTQQDAASEAGQDSGQGGSAGAATDAATDGASADDSAAFGGNGGSVQDAAGADAQPAGSGGARPQGTATGDDSGCGCRTDAARGWASGWLAWALLSLVVARRARASYLSRGRARLISHRHDRKGGL
jgi:sugar lactone lactonase YvrE